MCSSDLIRSSNPTDLETSSISAPTFSQMAEMELMELIRCANMEFATNFESSEDQRLVVTIFERGTHAAYTSARALAARRPLGVSEEPMITRSGSRRLVMAVPAARNSGLERTSKLRCGRWIRTWGG